MTIFIGWILALNILIWVLGFFTSPNPEGRVLSFFMAVLSGIALHLLLNLPQ